MSTRLKVKHYRFEVFLLAFLITLGTAQSEMISPNDSRIVCRGVAYPQASSERVELLRFSPQLLKDAKPPTHGFNPGKARSTSGASLSFITDSPTLTLRFESEAWWDFAIMQNGKVSSVGQVKNDNTLTIESIDPGAAVEFRVIMPNFKNPIFTGLEIAEGRQLFDPPKTRPLVYAALGDSISHGRGQKVGHETWPWQVAELLDMELYNVAVGGSNANAYQSISIAELPKVDLVSILWGYNDWVNKGKSLSEYTTDMNAAIDVIRAKHSQTPIAIFSLLQTLTTKSKRTGEQFSAADFRGAAEALVSSRRADGDTNIHLLVTNTMTNTLGDLAAGNPVHLSLSGASKLAKAVAPELKKLLK